MKKGYAKNPKPPVPLFTADGVRKDNIFACGECGTYYSTVETATKCCKQTVCDICGADTEQHRIVCSDCGDKKMWDNAEEIKEWDGPVYDDSRDKYFGSYDEAIEYFEDIKDEEDGGAPEFLQPCREYAFPGIDLDHALERMTEDMFEDAYDRLWGIEDLQKAVDIFNEKNKHFISWGADSKRKIRVVMP